MNDGACPGIFLLEVAQFPADIDQIVETSLAVGGHGGQVSVDLQRPSW